VVGPINQNRDIVFFDQRGTGHSAPRLSCPEREDVFVDSFATVKPAADTQISITAYQACHERLVDEGLPLSHHTSVDVAFDIAAFMELLDHPVYHLYGISYGTRIVQAMLRSAPEGVASAILDSTVEMRPTTWAAKLQSAFDTLVSECEASAACAAEHPDLAGALNSVVSELNENPHPVTVAVDGKKAELFITGDRLVVGLSEALRRAQLIGTVPVVIDEAASGKYALIDAFASQLAPNGTNDDGYTASVRCAEVTPFLTPELIAEANDGVSEDFVRAMSAPNEDVFTQVCDFWQVEVVPDEEVTPIESDIPTLVLAGLFDPATPPAQGERVANMLNNSQFVLFEGLGHGVLRSDTWTADAPSCAQSIARQFLDDPTSPADTGCVAMLPAPFD
jgi:pimeloyl-ACP methyl ester carboxylesterase